MIKTVGELVKELKKYPKNMDIAVYSGISNNIKTIQRIDSIKKDYAMGSSSNTAYPIVFIYPTES